MSAATLPQAGRPVIEFSRRGACPALSVPMRTGDGLLVRLNPLHEGLSPSTLIGLCNLASAHGNGIVEVTARGSFQIRGLTDASAALLAREVDAMGIAIRTGVPVQTAPLAGLDPSETADPRPLAAAIRAGIDERGLNERLAPKVSVVVDGGGHSALAAVAGDVRLTAVDAEHWIVAVAGDAAEATPLATLSIAEACDAAVTLLSAIADLGPAARGRDLQAACATPIRHPAQRGGGAELREAEGGHLPHAAHPSPSPEQSAGEPDSTPAFPSPLWGGIEGGGARQTDVEQHRETPRIAEASTIPPLERAAVVTAAHRQTSIMTASVSPPPSRAEEALDTSHPLREVEDERRAGGRPIRHPAQRGGGAEPPGLAFGKPEDRLREAEGGHLPHAAPIAEANPPPPLTPPHKGEGVVSAALSPGAPIPLTDARHALPIALPFGSSDAATLVALLGKAASEGVEELRLAPNRILLALCPSPEAAARLRDHASSLRFITSPDDPRAHIAACPGAPACASAYLPARDIALRAADALAGFLAGGATLHVSGCAKGCARQEAATITIVGDEKGAGCVVGGTAKDRPLAYTPPEGAVEGLARVAALVSQSARGDAGKLAGAFERA